MLNREILENQLAEFPLFAYGFLDPKSLEFTQRVRYICQSECPMYGKSWACPPAVGSVEECEKKCFAFSDCLMIATITEVAKYEARYAQFREIYPTCKPLFEKLL